MGVRRDETLRDMSQTPESRAKRGTEEADQGSIRALFFFSFSRQKAVQGRWHANGCSRQQIHEPYR
jgi:hypothetical protein